MEITISPTIKQHRAWEILEDNQTEEFLFGGGGGGGKSYLGCEWLISMCLRYPNTKYFIARKRLKTLKQTTLITFFKVCRAHGLKRDVHYRYREQQAVIEFLETGASIDLLDVDFRPSDPEYEDLGSAEYTSGWIEEGGEVHFGAFDTLTTRVGRQLNDMYGIMGKVFITCNPKKNWLYKLFYKPWKSNQLPTNRKFMQSLVGDNPYIDAGYINKLKNIKSIAKKQRLLLGKWEYDDDPSALVNYEAISDLFTNSIEKSEDKYLTVDIARFGDDLTVLKFWQGLEVYKVIIRSKQGTDVTTQLIRDEAHKEQIPYSHIAVDEDGVGGGVVDALPGIRGFVANSKPLEDIRIKEDQEDLPNYRTLKAQCAYMLADEINNHRIAVKPKVIDYDEEIEYDELLTEDLEQIKAKDIDVDDKKLDIVSKEQTREILGRSTDFGDPMIMRMIFFLKLPHEKTRPKIYKPKWSSYNKI